MFVGAFDRSLHGGAEGGFGVIDQGYQRQLVQIVDQAQLQLRAAALAVRGGDYAFGRAKPSQYIGVLQRLIGEVVDKLLLNQLP